ncbi:MAG: DUF3088 family protein [Pseudomonadota bacterium]
MSASADDPTKDLLYLLAPGFEANGRREYCPECAEIWGLLGYFPAIAASLEVRYQPLDHPRPGLVAMLGEGRWNCPTLILSDDVDPGPKANVRQSSVPESGDARFLDNARDIGLYFAYRFGTPEPRGA